MDDYENDLPIVRSVFDKLVAKYPNKFFKMLFVTEVGEFFILTNDYSLADTAEYNQFIDKLEDELFNQTNCRVIFSTHSFNTRSPKGEFEINNFSSQETEALLHSAN